MDAADLQWCPNASSVAVQDSVLAYRVFIVGPNGSSVGNYRCVCVSVGVLVACVCVVCVHTC